MYKYYVEQGTSNPSKVSIFTCNNEYMIGYKAESTSQFRSNKKQGYFLIYKNNDEIILGIKKSILYN